MVDFRVCEHANARRAPRPIPDYWTPCPDCGVKVSYRGGRWITVYENNVRAHSAKPEGFIDVVEQVSPGPYVELFARRARFGWDYWGDESLGTAEMPEEKAA